VIHSRADSQPATHLITQVPPRKHEGTLQSPPGATGTSGFVAAIPLPPSSEDAVKGAIERLDAQTFSNVAGTHFARLAVVGPSSSPGRAFHDARLRNAYLIFSADFDGDFSLEPPQGVFSGRRVGNGPGQFNRWAGDLWAELQRNESLANVFTQCFGFASQHAGEDFSQWLFEWVCPRLVYYNSLPDETLASIDAGLETSRQAFDALVGRESSATASERAGTAGP